MNFHQLDYSYNKKKQINFNLLLSIQNVLFITLDLFTIVVQIILSYISSM